MTWVPLGQLPLDTHEWTPFPNTVINAQTFRISHAWRIYPYKPMALIGLLYLGMQGIASIRRVYPSTEPVILVLPTPPDLVPSSLLTVPVVRRTFPYDTESGWRITLEVFYPD